MALFSRAPPCIKVISRAPAGASAPEKILSLTHAKTPRFSDRTAARAAGAGHPEEPELLEAVARHTLRLAASLLHTPAAGSQENTFRRRAPSFLRSLSPAQSRTAAPLGADCTTRTHARWPREGEASSSRQQRQRRHHRRDRSRTVRGRKPWQRLSCAYRRRQRSRTSRLSCDG